MNRFGLILIFSASLTFEALLLFSSCSPKAMSTSNDEPNKELPSIVSLSPSAFRCEANVIGLDSLRSTLLIRKIIQQGAALFYSVGIGDTIHAKIYTYQRNNLSMDLITELVIEERLKLNSEIPDFIIRQIISEKK
ncbi:MAG: hypothetical protein NTV09_06315 [Bacteroidetes bacterium]|nr:hypothetical protein [Bacteroidota bacterium]